MSFCMIRKAGYKSAKENKDNSNDTSRKSHFGLADAMVFACKMVGDMVTKATTQVCTNQGSNEG